MLNPEQALRALIDDGVAAGSLNPGSRLPTERELVERLGVPRGAIRQSLAQLEDEGVIERHVGRGTFLRSTGDTPRAPADSSPAEIMQARLVIEPAVASAAARVATQTDLERITACWDEGGRSRTFEDFEMWDARLHRAIAESAHNGVVMSMFDVMNTARALPVWGTLKRRTSSPERRCEYHDHHGSIVEALRNRDPEAAEETMRRHLRAVSETLLGGITG